MLSLFLSAHLDLALFRLGHLGAVLGLLAPHLFHQVIEVPAGAGQMLGGLFVAQDEPVARGIAELVFHSRCCPDHP